MFENFALIKMLIDWVASPAGAALFAGLFAASEALAAIPAVQSNSVFQAVFAILKKLAKK